MSSVSKWVIRLLLSSSLACYSERREEGSDTVSSSAEFSTGGGAAGSWISKDQEIAWKSWSAVFREASERDCPILLYLAAPGYEGLLAAESPALRFLVEERFVGVQVDPFQRPDIARRYPTGGWPALVAMLPDGRAFAMAVDIPADNVELFLLRLLETYEEKRDLIEEKVSQAESRTAQIPSFTIDADQVYHACAAAYDSAHGGFGQGVKFPETIALGFLQEYSAIRGSSAAWEMVEKTLDALLASPLVDARRGGVCAFSYTPDWQTPVREKDGLDQAGLLLLLLEVAADRDRPDYAVSARLLAKYVAEELFDGDQGAFRGRQVGVAEGGWWTDPLIYANRHALLIQASAAAARHLGDGRSARMARTAGEFLIEHCIDESGAVQHVCGQSGLPALLEDQVLAIQALLDLHALTGESRFEEAARTAFRFIEIRFFDRQAQAFVDRLVSTGMEDLPLLPLVPYRDDFLPAGNALAADLYMRLDDPNQARALLKGTRLRKVPGRIHCGCARVALKLSERRGPVRASR